MSATDLEHLHAGMTQGIDEEIAEVKRQLARWGGDVPVGADRVTSQGKDLSRGIFTFHLSEARRVPEETPVMVRHGDSGKRSRGYVVSVAERGRRVRIAFDEPPDRVPESATLEFDPTELLVQLKARVTEAAADPERARLGISLLTGTDLPGPDPQASTTGLTHGAPEELNEGQRAAASLVCSAPASLVFGPPGTGKTSTAAATIAELSEGRQERVLVLAHTNGALDTLLAQVAQHLPSRVRDGTLVRLGEPGPRLSGHSIGEQEQARAARNAELSSEASRALLELEQLARDLSSAIVRASSDGSAKDFHFARFYQPSHTRSVNATLRELKDFFRRLQMELDTGKVSGVRQQRVERGRALIDEVERAREADTRDVVRRARIVGATLTKMTLSEEINDSRWDAVLVDEASMALLPHVFVAASLARSRIALFGDPVQLSPVVQAKSSHAHHWLARSAFETSGADDPAEDPPFRALLTDQHRMNPSIRAIVSDLFYAGRLRDAPAVRRRRGPDGPPLALVDTSQAQWSDEIQNSSRKNPGNAHLVTEIVRALVQDGESDIGIATPYRPQSRELFRHIRDAGLTPHAEIGTVHRFQGGERSTMIFDLTATPPLGDFLDERKTPDARRLVNVGISRAEQRLVVVGHARGVRQTFGESSFLTQLLIKAYYDGLYVRADEVLANPACLTVHDTSVTHPPSAPRTTSAVGSARRDGVIRLR